MNIVQITPGAGGMFCGGCFRDNTLVGSLRQLGHQVLMVPLYLPLTLDENDNSRGTPTFFGGINVYLEQKSAWFRHAPEWMHRVLRSPALLKFAGKLGARTRAEDLGDITVSMLRGEDGNQARELDTLIEYLRDHVKPDVVCLSNALLIGLARRIRNELDVPVACLLSGEDTFLDALPASHRSAAWSTLAARAREVDVCIAPSRYYSELMQQRLGLRPEQLRVVWNGINLDGYPEARSEVSNPPVLGYFARMCRDKGLDLLIETYIALRQRQRIPALRLKVGGGLGPSDEPLVQSLKNRVAQAGLSGDVEWHPNLDRAQKIQFLASLDVFCTPAMYGEAFGLYVIEALAAGVPVVQPRHGGFPELVEATGGGRIAEPTAAALAEAIEQVISHPVDARALGRAGQSAAQAHFSSAAMARAFVQAIGALRRPSVSERAAQTLSTARP